MIKRDRLAWPFSFAAISVFARILREVAMHRGIITSLIAAGVLFPGAHGAIHLS
jgi:hypothetical protein